MGKIISFLTIIIALTMATLASTLPLERLQSVVLALRFFESMLPVLGVGALVKYLFDLKMCCKKDCKTECAK